MLGLIIIVYALNHLYEQVRFTAIAEKTEAKILSLTKKEITSVRYYPVFSFFDKKDLMHVVTSKTGFKKNEYRPGDLIPVRYHPGKPEIARIDTFLNLWGRFFMYFFFGLFSMSLGYKIYKKYSN